MKAHYLVLIFLASAYSATSPAYDWLDSQKTDLDLFRHRIGFFEDGFCSTCSDEFIGPYLREADPHQSLAAPNNTGKELFYSRFDPVDEDPSKPVPGDKKILPSDWNSLVTDSVQITPKLVKHVIRYDSQERGGGINALNRIKKSGRFLIVPQISELYRKGEAYSHKSYENATLYDIQRDEKIFIDLSPLKNGISQHFENSIDHLEPEKREVNLDPQSIDFSPDDASRGAIRFYIKGVCKWLVRDCPYNKDVRYVGIALFNRVGDKVEFKNAYAVGTYLLPLRNSGSGWQGRRELITDDIREIVHFVLSNPFFVSAEEVYLPVFYLKKERETDKVEIKYFFEKISFSKSNDLYIFNKCWLEKTCKPLREENLPTNPVFFTSVKPEYYSVSWDDFEWSPLKAGRSDTNNDSIGLPMFAHYHEYKRLLFTSAPFFYANNFIREESGELENGIKVFSPGFYAVNWFYNNVGYGLLDLSGEFFKSRGTTNVNSGIPAFYPYLTHPESHVSRIDQDGYAIGKTDDTRSRGSEIRAVWRDDLLPENTYWASIRTLYNTQFRDETLDDRLLPRASFESLNEMGTLSLIKIESISNLGDVEQDKCLFSEIANGHFCNKTLSLLNNSAAFSQDNLYFVPSALSPPLKAEDILKEGRMLKIRAPKAITLETKGDPDCWPTASKRCVLERSYVKKTNSPFLPGIEIDLYITSINVEEVVGVGQGKNSGRSFITNLTVTDLSTNKQESIVSLLMEKDLKGTL